MRVADGHASTAPTKFATVGRARPRPTYWSRSRGMTPDYNLRDPFGYSAINTPARGRVRIRRHAGPAVGAVPVHRRLHGVRHARRTATSPAARRQVPANILVLNAAGSRRAGCCAISTTPTPRAIDLPYQLVRGEQTVDNFEVGIKADWARRPVPHQRHGLPNRLGEHDRARPTSRRSGGTSTATASPRRACRARRAAMRTNTV